MMWDFMSLVFAPLKCFNTTLQARVDIFQALMPLTIETPSMTVTRSFLLSGVSFSVLSLKLGMFCVAIFIALCFAVTFVLGK